MIVVIDTVLNTVYTQPNEDMNNHRSIAVQKSTKKKLSEIYKYGGRVQCLMYSDSMCELAIFIFCKCIDTNTYR